MDATLRALNRFGLGARIGERDSIRDPKGWLLEQLDAAPAPAEAPGLPTLAEAGDALQALRAIQPDMDPERAREARTAFQGIRQAEASFALSRRVTTEDPFVERLVAFWSNHLCVSVAGKQPIVVLAGLYEREVIRPHVLGSFTDMVLASAKHPAMLFYLDNFQSIGPTSQRATMAARRLGQERGLNENYARELLELHTLGVDGGYVQMDIEALARILTGWTVLGAGPRMLGGMPGGLQFRFDPALHEPGAKTLLGITYRQAGLGEGESAIRALTVHPSTARFIATKLVVHFVSDTPPEGAVSRIADVFLEGEGNLKAVAAALVELDGAWDPATRKLRTPQDWMVAVLRAGGAEAVPPQAVQLLEQLRHPLWAPSSPKGYGDLVRDWADPDGLMNRAELAQTFVQRLGQERRDPGRFLEVVDLPEDDPLHSILTDVSIPAPERVALAVAGPAFHWR